MREKMTVDVPVHIQAPERAIELDPSFAVGYAAMGGDYSVSGL